MRSSLGLLLLLALHIPAPAEAQEVDLSVGGSIGLLSVAAPEGVCSRNDALGAGEGRLRLDQQRFGIEIRAAWHWAVARYSCGYVLIPPEEGVFRDDESWVLPREGLVTELRLYSPPIGLGARANLGGGWLWSPKIPFFAAGVALRSPATLQGRLRVQLEADALTSRVRYDGMETEWRNHQQVRTSRVERSAWEPGVAFRAGVEFALR